MPPAVRPFAGFYSVSLDFALFFPNVESFTLAAAAIMDASTSFVGHKASTSGRRGTEMVAPLSQPRPQGKQPQRAHTFSKAQIDSTPRTAAKFDKPYLERYKDAFIH